MKKPVRGIRDNRILNELQKRFIQEFARSDLSRYFRLSGGTALSAFYLEHRYSEDLDFFSSENIPVYFVDDFLKSLRYISEIKRTKHFDRNIYLLKIDEDFLRVEFTHYPLKILEDLNAIDGLMVEGFLDIVVNKLCAVADRIDVKDYVDLYFALKEENLLLEELFGLAEKKCEVSGINHILRSRLMDVPEGIEKLPLLKDVKKKEMEEFFYNEIKRILEKEIDKG